MGILKIYSQNTFLIKGIFYFLNIAKMNKFKEIKIIKSQKNIPEKIEKYFSKLFLEWVNENGLDITIVDFSSEIPVWYKYIDYYKKNKNPLFI